MSQLWDRIKAAIQNERLVIGVHAAIRLRQRRIPSWQVVGVSLEGRLLKEVPRSRPNPKVEVDILLPDGTDAKAVWAWLASDESAKLVTVHFYDE